MKTIYKYKGDELQVISDEILTPVDENEEEYRLIELND